MRALAVRQPWAWLIVHGFKTIENKKTRYKIRGRILIHASMARPEEYDLEDAQLLLKEMGTDPKLLPKTFERGGIVGSVEIVDCISSRRELRNKQDRVWYEPIGGYNYGLVLRNATPLPFRSYKGKLGFFDVELTPEEEQILSNLPVYDPQQDVQSEDDTKPSALSKLGSVLTSHAGKIGGMLRRGKSK